MDIIDRPAEMLTKYERARLIGSRALQISQGAPLLLKLSEKDLEDIKYNPVEIAKRELAEGVLPITISREIEKPTPEEPKE